MKPVFLLKALGGLLEPRASLGGFLTILLTCLFYTGPGLEPIAGRLNKSLRPTTVFASATAFLI